MPAILRQFYRKIIYAFTLIRVGAIKVFIKQLLRQLYSRDRQICLVKSMENLEKNPVDCPIRYHLREASGKDMKEAFQKVKTESTESKRMLVKRKWFYDRGCGKWFVARTDDEDELCFLQCVITSEDNKLVEKDFKQWLPRLNEGDFIFEGAYTFEKYRRNRIAGSTMFDLMELYKNKGYKRLLLYIDDYRESQLLRTEKRGFTRYEVVTLSRILFFSNRTSRPYKQPGDKA